MSNATHGPAKRRYATRMPVEDRREQLMDAALSLLSRAGYDGLSVGSIAEEAGVTRPVVYAAFDGLEPLLYALLHRTQARALEQVLELLREAGRPDDVDAWLVRAIDGLIDRVASDPDVWRPVLGITRGAPAVVQERIDATRELIRGEVASALAAGLERRGGPALDAEVISHLILASAQELGRLVLEERPRYDKARLVSALRGLLAAAPAPPG